jgi:hypothetical protein
MSEAFNVAKCFPRGFVQKVWGCSLAHISGEHPSEFRKNVRVAHAYVTRHALGVAFSRKDTKGSGPLDDRYEVSPCTSRQRPIPARLTCATASMRGACHTRRRAEYPADRCPARWLGGPSSLWAGHRSRRCLASPVAGAVRRWRQRMVPLWLEWAACG